MLELATWNIPAAFHQQATADSGDTAWLLASAALVMLMTPGLAFFYGGLVGRKNVLSTVMHSFVIICVVGVQWVLWGYTLSFGPDAGGGIIGNLEWLGLRMVGGDPSNVYATTTPHLAFMMFQGMFAIITPALISGAFAERMKFSTFLVFTIVWATLVYDPIAHWVWAFGEDGAASGWIGKMGALDFAGGTVVHINAGLAALAAALMIKPRLGLGREPKEPHNIPFVVLGAALLWFGWFGFNAGSAVAANALAANAFVVTNTAAAAAGLSWMTMAWWKGGAPGAVGVASGVVAGLVAITPASGFVGPMAAVIIGLGAGVFCYFAARMRTGWRNLDDALDVFAVHGIGGIWGAMATGLFATVAVNAAGADGLFNGGGTLILKQLAAVGATMAYSFIMTWVILWVLNKLMGLRVKSEDEELGLDEALHGEIAYR